jgi:diguanylate cyclase (GGDEF)-like protein/PAS domain S-box-containing protein
MMLLMVGLFGCLGTQFIALCLANSLSPKHRKIKLGKCNIPDYIPSEEMFSIREEKYNYLWKNNQEVLFQTDAAGIWIFLNPVWTEITGFSLAETLGTSFLNYVHPEDSQHKLDLFQILSQSQIKDSLHKIHYLTKDGGCCCLEVYVHIILDSKGKIMGTSGTLKTINPCRIEAENCTQQHKISKRATALNSGNHYLEALVEIEQVLLTFDDNLQSYMEVLETLGQTCTASRVYLYKNHYSDNGDLVITKKAEWCASDIQSQISENSWQNPAKSEFYAYWTQILAKGNIISGIVSEFSAAERQILEQEGILAIIILPIMIKDKFLGYIGFDNCLETQTWAAAEVAFMQAVAGAFALTYERLSAEKALKSIIIETGNFTTQLENQVQEHTAQLNREIAELKHIQVELQKSLSLQLATIESIADGILVIDSHGNIAGFNQKFVQMWQIPQLLMESGNYRQALRLAVRQLENPQEYLHTIRELSLNSEVQIYDAIVFKDGRVFERYCQPQYIDGKIIGRVLSFRDVTAYKLAEATIRYQASHDLLTDLPNRALFNQKLSESLAQAAQFGRQLSVCFLDLDRFQTINDTLGHSLGDQLLKNVAQRLKQCLRQGDILARWGGDEFTLLLPEISNIQDVIQIQEKILAAFKTGFDVENHHLHISPSMGISIYPTDGENAETLIKHADAALNQVKLQGRNNYQFYHSAINSQASELLTLENSLHHALERGEFRVYYQPQVKVSTGEIPKLEALIRWQHPELGLISPGKFIPLAEETGLIIPICKWVLRTACMQTKAWQDALDLPCLSIAVNISARQFQQDLVVVIQQVLSETKLNPQCLELEITESIAMQNIELSRKILHELHDLGISISIDDFGTGYCSLSYLKNFPINTLKIDKSFVHDLIYDNNSQAITTAIIALAHGLNLAVVAEGVETKAQRDLLQVLKCELMQGYLFSYPLPDEAATKFLSQSKFRKSYNSYLANYYESSLPKSFIPHRTTRIHPSSYI